MNAIQLQIRTDINYLADSWKTPKIYPVNGDISKEKSFEKKPALLSFLKPEESDAGKNGGKLQTWVVELFLVYSKLPEGADPANKSSDFDTQSSEMIEILEKLHSGLTKKYIGSVKNPIAHSRGYESKSAISYLDTYFEFGANKYMAVRATFKMLVPVAACFDCTDYVDGTFESVNVPPYNSNPIGGNTGSKGDIIYWNDVTNNWVRLGIGEEEQVLSVVDGVPAWVDASSGGGTLTCENVGDCETIINIENDLAEEILERTTAQENLQDDIDEHELRTDNPHSVTKIQVGLGNVDNTSDLNKPVSTAQADADAAVLAAANAHSDGLVAGLLDDRGSYDASGNTFPASGGSGTAGAIMKGDIWYISVAGILGGVAVTVGDSVRAITDAPGQTATNWSILETNIGYVPENVANKATAMAGNTTSNVVYLTAKAIYDWATATFQTALGYTAENTANKTDTMAGNTASSTKYLSAKGVYDYLVATYQAIITADSWGTFINSLSSKTTPVDADYLPLMDSADSNDAKKLSWANLKATLKTYFDTLYLTAYTGHYLVLKSFTGNTITGTTSESILFSEAIAGGTFQANDVPEISASVQRATTSGSFVLKVYINTSNSLSGATNIFTSGTIASNVRSYNFTRKNSWFSSSTNFKTFGGLNTSSSSDEGAAMGPAPADVAWTAANNYYLIVTITPNNSGDTFTPAHLIILNKR